MKKRYRTRSADLLRPLALGLSDGILNALILASAAVLGDAGGVGFGLAARVAVVAFVTGAVTFFIAEYAHLRGELVRAEQQLNITQAGRLATGRLGRRALNAAAGAAFLAGVAGLAGALLPLVIGALVPRVPWIALAAAVTALGGLGAALARTISGRPWRWAITMLCCGVIVAAIGVQLKIT